MKKIAVTCGDPTGVGPELVLKVLSKPEFAGVCELIGSRTALELIAQKFRLPVPPIIDPNPAFNASSLEAGQHTALSGAIAAAAIEYGIAGCLDGRYAALVTAPISKTAIHAAGVPFPGHTQWCAARAGLAEDAVTMCLTGKELTVALATDHLSLAEVVRTLSPDQIVRTGRHMWQFLRRLHPRPLLALCALNPHAGESSAFGDEESRILAPALKTLLAEGIAVEGPLPPDTAFAPHNRRRYQGHICCYHDQGLIPFKALCFEDGVNLTLGLPFIRTSPDHGTASSLAWQGTASSESLEAALRLAIRLAEESNKDRTGYTG